MVEEVISGNPANSSVSEIGDVARKTDIEELSHTTIFKNSDDIALGEKALSNVEVNKLDDVAEVVESGSTTVIYWSGDIANYQYNMIENPGPLAEMPNQPAKNFYGGRYNMEVLQEDRIMYRAGNAQNPYGRWFTSEPPASVTNVRIDAAVKTHWIDPKTGAYEASSYIDNVYAIKVPKGTTIYTGSVGPQGGVYVGGYNVMQTYIDAPWTFEVVGKTPLQQIGDRRMIRNEEFLQLREAYIEIGKMVQKYGYGQYNGILRILMGQVNCIDSDESNGEKMKYLIESYSKLFASPFMR